MVNGCADKACVSPKPVKRRKQCCPISHVKFAGIATRTKPLSSTFTWAFVRTPYSKQVRSQG